MLNGQSGYGIRYVPCVSVGEWSGLETRAGEIFLISGRAVATHRGQAGFAVNSRRNAAASAGEVPSGIEGSSGSNFSPQREQASKPGVTGCGSVNPLSDVATAGRFHVTMNCNAARIWSHRRSSRPRAARRSAGDIRVSLGWIENVHRPQVQSPKPEYSDTSTRCSARFRTPPSPPHFGQALPTTCFSASARYSHRAQIKLRPSTENLQSPTGVTLKSFAGVVMASNAPAAEGSRAGCSHLFQPPTLRNDSRDIIPIVPFRRASSFRVHLCFQRSCH